MNSNISVIKEFELLGSEISGLRGHFVVCFKGRYFEVNESVVEFIETLKRSSSQEEARSIYSQIKGRKFSEEEFDRIADKCLKPILDSVNKEPRKMFLAQMELFSASKIKRFSELMRFLFGKKTFIAIIIIIAILEILFFAISTTEISTGRLDFYTILGVFFLFLASSCFHELGHASACRHFGVSHGGVGIGLYLSFPVFYTDVSETWRLTRKQRLVVNTAGVYFQLLFLSPIIIIYLFTGNEILKYFIYTVNVNFLITLNPFFKFDGYWIVSDLLGVPNLRTRTKEYLVYLINKIRGKSQTTKPFFLSLKKSVRYILAVYSLLVNLFFAYVFGYTIPLFLINYFKTVPEQIKAIAMQLASGQTPPFPLIKSIVMSTLFFGFFAYMIVRMLKPLVVKLIKRKV